MTAIVTSPGGSSTAPFSVIGGLGWDPTSSTNVHLGRRSPNGPLLAASSGPDLGSGRNQGACISPTFAGSQLKQGAVTVYWEILWNHLIDPNLVGGIGVGTITGGTPATTAPAFGDLALDGTGGCILRPDGTVWNNGQQSGGQPVPQVEGDSVGIFLTLRNQPPNLSTGVQFIGVGGTIAGQDIGTTLFDLGTFVPVVVFDSETSGLVNGVPTMQVIANFGGGGANGFLGPSVFGSNFFKGVIMGWPSNV